MRRASTCLAVLGLSMLALTGVASAVPTVKFTAKAVPIPGFPHTGNILGAGAAVEAEYTIAGTEYEGSPPPVIGVNFFFPKGVKLSPSGFPTCAPATLEQIGPSGCKKGSSAGPIGKAVGFVSFGGERVIENAEISTFYGPGGGIEFFTAGHSPVSLEILSKGSYTQLGGAGGFGPKLVAQVPLVASVPGAPYRLGQIDQGQGRLGDQVARQSRNTTERCRKSAPRAASRSRPKSSSPKTATSTNRSRFRLRTRRRARSTSSLKLELSRMTA